MKELNDFLNGCVVSKNADIKVLVNGEYVDINTPRVTETKDNDFDVYIVNNAGIDPDIADIADVIVYCSSKPIDYNPKANPERTMRNKRHVQNILSPNLVVYSMGEIPVVSVSEPKSIVEPVIKETVGTTLEPEAVGTPLSISGGAPEPESTDNVEPPIGKVW